MALAAVDLELKYGYGAWVRTSTGWIPAAGEVEREQKDTPGITVTLRPVGLQENAKRKDFNSCRPIIVRGTRRQRHISVSLSEMLKFLEMEEAAVEIRSSAYVYEVLLILVRDYLEKVSGTTHRLLFQMIEAMTHEALKSEQQLDRMTTLTVTAMKSLLELGTNRVGCSSLWKKHLQTLTNLSTQLEQFEVTQREEDGRTMFMDLPKECIREIMLGFSEPRDLLRLGQCNLDLYYMTQDMSLWENLAQFHFTEKQMLNFLSEEDIGEGTEWRNVFKKCHRKYGSKKVYGDSVGLCSKCKVLHWTMKGHECWGSENEVAEIEQISPSELIRMTNL